MVQLGKTCSSAYRQRWGSKQSPEYAVFLVDHLSATAQGHLTPFDLRSYLEPLDWLPSSNFKELLAALKVPYFWPDIGEYLQDKRLGSDKREQPPFQALNSDLRRSVRLLYMLPSLGHDEPLRGRLMPVSLDTLPKFDALSYTWGDSRSTREVLIAGQQVNVTDNLHRILQTMCAQSQGQTPALWVDVVCINQRNPTERHHQVTLIGNMFRSAQEVVFLHWVWR